ncbi:MAG TPA: D-alanyl-D-alanine carboxypeptidase/D-alanyl-D-alanine-endopeptidase [Gaiellaceae bacterium]|nr:D-alanyl-D-alanine carboxypeptidase/D-alanyl-D-alanine-endopeptidase [Gaiellaceae bacterium]
MPRRLVVITVVTFVVAATGTAAATGRPHDSPLASRLARALSVPNVPASRSAAVAVELTTGRTVFARHQALALVPASNQKLAVAFAALSLLGPTHRFDTAVYGEGERVGQTWKGDLVLKGYGDPTLTRGDLRALAFQVRAEGIRSVSGGIEADETYFDSRRAGPAWKPRYYLNESASLSALTVDRARFRGFMTRTPALAAGRQFRLALRSVGVSVRRGVEMGIADTLAEQLATTESAPLAQIVGFMNRESDNFTAELLLKQLGAVDEGIGTSAAGAKSVRRVLEDASIPLAGVRIIDGSGLSPQNRLTAAALIGMLVAAWRQPAIRPAFLQSLAVAGVNGTLEDRMRSAPARGAVRAKTGTTLESSALSGYVRTRFAFAVLHNGHPVSHYWARRAQDRFAAALAAQ